MGARLRMLGLRLAVLGLAASAVAADAAQPVAVDGRGRPLYEPGVVAVKLRAGTNPAAKARTGRLGIPELDPVLRQLRVERVEPMFRTRLAKARPELPDLSRIYRVALAGGTDVERAARLLGRSPAVEYAEPVVRHYTDLTPNDPSFAQQTFWQQILAEAAWDVHKGEDGAEVVVGISDSGVAWRHEDLVDNIHRNLGEDADGDGTVIVQEGGAWVFDPGDVNGVDDDRNGYVDDFVGWNFLNDEGGQDNDPDDPESHGTHVAGLAAARTDNGVGVASISWNVKILPTSGSNSASEGTVDRSLSTVVYLAENGADIINMSWGGSTSSQLQQDVMDYARGLGSLLVTSAGNERTSDLQYPSALPGLISVAAVASADRLTSYSNYGLSVDVAAPGGDGLRGLRSTIPAGYGSKQGTSMASPIVAGVFALVKSLHPQWSNQRLFEQVLGTADPIDDLNPSFAGLLGHGRVNAFAAVSGAPSSDPPQLRLQVMGVAVLDDTGDGSLEAGEGAELRVALRNFNQLGGSQALALSLHSDSPYVQVVDPNVFTAIGADERVEPAETFAIEVAADAPTGLYRLSVSAAAADAEVSAASELELPPLVVASGGVLVWEGAEGLTFSGRYLAAELAARGYDVLTLAGDFPSGLVGFDAVFLSFGNAGLDDPALGLDYQSARLDAEWKVEAIRSYLESGGRLYLEGGDTLGYDVYDLVDGEDLLPLFGIASGVDGGTNQIDSLEGQADTLTEGLQFLATTQDPVEWIDIFTPGAGLAAFVESGYGVVAVQNAGRYGQKTFAFAYSIADLTDGPSTRGELLDAILDFLQPGQEPPAASPRRAGRRLTPGP